MAAAGIAGQKSEGCEGKAETAKQGVATATTTTNVCLIYPCMFFGSYTMYYGMQWNGTTMTCDTPRGVSAPNNMALGCTNACPQFTIDAHSRLAAHPGMEEKGSGKIARFDGKAHGVEIALSDELVISVDDPNSNAMPPSKTSLTVRLLQVDIDPTTFDKTHLDADVVKAINAQTVGKTVYIGHEIQGNPSPSTSPFGTFVSATPTKLHSHVISVKMTNSTEAFEIVLKRRR